MELIHEDKLIQEFDRFLESKDNNSSKLSDYTEFDLFTDIQYLKILESQLEQCKSSNLMVLEKCESSSTKVVSKTYTILTPAYLKRIQKNILEAMEKIHQVIAAYLNNASQYAGFIDTNYWFEWWAEYVESLTDEEYAYIADCKKQAQEPIMIHPTDSLEQFVLKRQGRLNEQPKLFQKDYFTPEIA